MGHHNLMQVVGAHTLEEHREMKGVTQYCNCMVPSYTMIMVMQQRVQAPQGSGGGGGVIPPP